MSGPQREGVQWRSRIRLVDEVVEVIRDRIYAGEYRPGERLRQEQLAGDLEISRTPLREALRILESEKLVEVMPRGGLRVISPDRTTLLAAYEFREVLDGLAARLAARHTSAALERSIRASLTRQAAALDPWDAAAYTHENVAFHTLVYEAAHNDYVTGSLPVMRMTAQVFTPVPLIESSRAVSAIEQHREIAARILAGDERGAERQARRHIQATIKSLAHQDFGDHEAEAR